MNILQICNKSPYPPKEGGPIAMYNLADGLLKAGNNLDILTINTNKYFVNVETLPADYLEKTSFSAVYIDVSISLFDAFVNLFSQKSYHIKRFESVDMDRKIQEILTKKKFDIIQLETVYVGCYISIIRKYSKATIILRSHNIEHLIWKRHALKVKNPLKKFYLNYLANKLRPFEKKVFDDVDGIACISDIDTSFIKETGILTPVKTIPFGVQIPKNISLTKNSEELTFFHLGSMDWIPNQEGIKWFLDFCMPLVDENFPEIKVFLAGRNMPSWVDNYNFKNLKNIGEVDDATEFINNHDIMFVPLFSGSGVRIKIIEGMSLGKVIISTTIGAEGINCTDGKDILIADTPEQFLEKIRFCVENRESCRTIGNNAKELIQNQHNIEKTTDSLMEFYKSILH